MIRAHYLLPLLRLLNISIILSHHLLLLLASFQTCLLGLHGYGVHQLFLHLCDTLLLLLLAGKHINTNLLLLLIICLPIHFSEDKLILRLQLCFILPRQFAHLFISSLSQLSRELLSLLFELFSQIISLSRDFVQLLFHLAYIVNAFLA